MEVLTPDTGDALHARLKSKAWPPIKIAALIDLMKQGATSGGATAVLRLRFGPEVTKGAVIGFAWRNGWRWRDPAQTYDVIWPVQRQRLPPGEADRRYREVRRERWHKTCVDLNHDTWEDLTAFAKRQGISRSEAIRTLLVWGLDGEDA